MRASGVQALPSICLHGSQSLWTSGLRWISAVHVWQNQISHVAHNGSVTSVSWHWAHGYGCVIFDIDRHSYILLTIKQLCIILNHHSMLHPLLCRAVIVVSSVRFALAIPCSVPVIA